MVERRIAFVLVFVAQLVMLAAGCGRSDLMDEPTGDDGGTGSCTSNADCPNGQTCDPRTHQCVPTGCDCHAPTPICRPDTQQCVECTNDTQCPNGEACQNFKCVQHCGPGGACPGRSTCCSSLCVDETSDPKNCGACGRTCGPYAHATATCGQSNCAIARCDVGFADCNRVVQDGCEVSTTNDVRNCGGCGHACAPGETCSGGVCAGACGPGGTCPPSLTCCGAACANTTSDPNNCGGCNRVCAQVPNATVGCTSSQCAIVSCNPGFADCNRTERDGCEVDTGSDPRNCGGCGIACPPMAACSGGRCVPPTGCNGGPQCVPGQTCCTSGCSDTTSDPQNCGGCGRTCPLGATCSGSRCVMTGCNGGPQCAPGQSCCMTGCTDTTRDTQNCGACGNACAPGDTCVGSMCKPPVGCNGGPACGPGKSCCASGCSDTTTDTQNCGQCGNACPAGNTCIGSMCIPPTSCNGGPACAPSQTCCSTGCADTQSDPNNCGRCGHTCGTTETCVGGTCAVNEGAFNPMVNPTYLTPGVHLFTTINVPPGAFVYVAGNGGASGTLELYATGTIVIDGTIDLSGGPGTQNTITSRSTNQGKAGSGGYTGEPYASAPASSACEFVAGNAGALGYAVAGTAGSCAVISSTTCITRNDPRAFIWAAAPAQFGGGAGVFTGYRAYGSGGGGPAGGAPGALGPAFNGESDCSGASGGGGAVSGAGGSGGGVYDGQRGTLGQTQCQGQNPGVPPAYVGGGGGGSIGTAAANDLAVTTTFRTGSGGGGGSADYLDRPVFGGTSGGGGGGGALRLSSPVSITVGGHLLANGGTGGDAFIGSQAPNCDPQPGAAGGGGSGGVVYLSSPVVTVKSGASVSAAGGAGGFGSLFATGGAGGNGGLGRIRVSATTATCTLAGSFSPPLKNGCNPTPGGSAGFAYVAAYPN